MLIAVRLLGSLLVIAPGNPPRGFGNRYQRFTASAPACYTDFWEAYEQVLPSKRHRAVGKETGKTSLIERFNNTLRQRVGRLVRKTLSFSKKVSNHIGAIWYFVHHYNASLRS
jgi:IS1 family transposase